MRKQANIRKAEPCDMRPRISLGSTFKIHSPYINLLKLFLGDYEFLFLFFISQIRSLRNMSALRLNSGPRQETKYFAILRQISPNYARLHQSPYARLRKMAKDCARLRKMA